MFVISLKFMNIQILLEFGHERCMEYQLAHNITLMHAQIYILKLFLMTMLLNTECLLFSFMFLDVKLLLIIIIIKVCHS
jgi:hypothetical protein